MKNMLLIMLLVLQPLVFANQCYFQSRRTSYDSGTSIKKISCQWLAQALQNIEFYNRGDNYAPYYERKFGKEGNLIEEVDGRIYMTKFYYALGAFRYYGQIIYSGANVESCKTTTSTGYCDQVEYNEFAMYLRDFFSSSVRQKKNEKRTSFSGKSSFRDSRDGKIYKTVNIGYQTWMAQNLNYEIYDGYGSWCYEDDANNCRKYGRLYTYEAAMQACPDGWHLPSTDEWKSLYYNATGYENSGLAVKKLKTKKGWGKPEEGGNGTDEFGFSALPAGLRHKDGSFMGRGRLTFFRTTNSTLIADFPMASNYGGFDFYSRENAYSVRCVKD